MVAFRRRRWLDQLVVRGGRGERDARKEGDGIGGGPGRKLEGKGARGLAARG